MEKQSAQNLKREEEVCIDNNGVLSFQKHKMIRMSLFHIILWTRNELARFLATHDGCMANFPINHRVVIQLEAAVHSFMFTFNNTIIYCLYSKRQQFSSAEL
jgi:hypothetical protein